MEASDSSFYSEVKEEGKEVADNKSKLSPFFIPISS
jgi:hypothetical protein